MPSKSLETRSLILQIIERIDALPNHSLAALRALRREFSHRLRDIDRKSVLLLASKLRAARVVHRFFSDELIANHNRAMSALTRRDLDIIGAELNSWDEVDCFATLVAGPAWRFGQITDADVTEWAQSKSRWWRRTALVCTTRLNVRGTNGSTERTLAVCTMLTEDRDDMVVKAMSWALRALAKRDSKSVATFIEQYRDQLAPRVVREVGNKLRTGLKTPRRATTIKGRTG